MCEHIYKKSQSGLFLVYPWPTINRPRIVYCFTSKKKLKFCFYWLAVCKMLELVWSMIVYCFPFEMDYKSFYCCLWGRQWGETGHVRLSKYCLSIHYENRPEFVQVDLAFSPSDNAWFIIELFQLLRCAWTVLKVDFNFYICSIFMF